ncbi:MAG: hypothetical protein JSV01_05095 [Desulfobacterales bacterium]|nr:MAG: hypothetical protein JSV01_05095 [Desulfobacterales bacterium]UCG80443.1 MAG: hypothetical protein JSV60_10865 [Desulfobacterales bacterium]
MPIRLVTYDPNEPGRDDSALFDAVKGYGPWAKLSESAYAVETSVSPEIMMEKIKKNIDPYDIVCIITLTSPYSVSGHEDLYDWLSRKL